MQIIGGREARNTAVPPTSEGSPQRPAGMRSENIAAALRILAQLLGVVGRHIARCDGVDV